MKKFAILLLLLAQLPTHAWDSANPKQLFQGDKFPTPPQQNVPWAADQTELSKTTELFFNLGLPDPRGCEYRELKIVTGDFRTGKGQVQSVHAWLLPNKKDNSPFAIAWNGLIYPVAELGTNVSLEEDVTKLSGMVGWESRSIAREDFESGALNARRITPIKALYLARLGMTKPAEELWRGTGTLASSQKVAKDWVWYYWCRALGAHLRGDDQLALSDTEFLTKLKPRLEATPEIQAAGTEPLLPVLEQLPSLLADSRRRLSAEPKSTVAAEPKSLEFLIWDLENVSGGPKNFNPFTLSSVSDKERLALVARGDAAVEALIDTIEHDKRLTRSVISPWFRFREARCRPVAAVAYSALTEILRTQFGDLSDEEKIDFDAQDIARIRQYCRQMKNRSLLERWYATLNDDTAGITWWLETGRNITSPGKKMFVPAPEFKTPLAGEPLRTKQGLSVSELLAKRSDEAASAKGPREQRMRNLAYAIEIALQSGKWDPVASAPVLQRRLSQLVDVTTEMDPESPNFVGDFSRNAAGVPADPFRPDLLNRTLPTLVLSLDQAGSQEGWRLLAKWLLLKKSQPVMPITELPLILAKGADQPAMAAALEKWFNDPQGGCYSVLAPGGPMRVDYFERSDLAVTPAFLRQALRNLTDQTKAGSLERASDNLSDRANFDRRIGQFFYPFSVPMAADVPGLGEKNDFRVCDYYAWIIGEKNPAAPKCEL